MKTVKEVSRLTRVSVRTLHYYDRIGLLKPTKVTDSGYRYYDDAAVERLRWIGLYQEIGFSLKQIAEIMDADDETRNTLLRKQIEEMEEKRLKLENRIMIAKGMEFIGVKTMNFEGFERDKIDDYSAQAKLQWGNTEAYREFEEKSRNRSDAEDRALGEQVMVMFEQLGAMRDLPAECEQVQNWVRDLQAFYTTNFYNCTDQILLGLGRMYAGGGSFTENIDAVGGKGTGAFALKAIEIYCQNK